MLRRCIGRCIALLIAVREFRSHSSFLRSPLGAPPLSRMTDLHNTMHDFCDHFLRASASEFCAAHLLPLETLERARQILSVLVPDALTANSAEKTHQLSEMMGCYFFVGLSSEEYRFGRVDAHHPGGGRYSIGTGYTVRAHPACKTGLSTERVARSLHSRTHPVSPSLILYVAKFTPYCNFVPISLTICNRRQVQTERGFLAFGVSDVFIDENGIYRCPASRE